MTSTESFDITAIGEALVDVVEHDGRVERLPGGSPMNVAVGLGRLGRRVAIVASIGDDEPGALLRTHLLESNVDLSFISIPEQTSTARAHLDASGSATYEFDIEWHLPSELIVPDSRLVHVGSIGSWREPGAEVVFERVRSRPREQVATFDPNVRPSLIEDRDAVIARIQALVSTVDLVKLSDEDAEWIYPELSHEAVLDRLVNLGTTIAVMTLGPHGAMARVADGLIQLPAQTVHVADTIGAGDSFMAGLIDAWINKGLPLGPDLERSIVEELITTALAAAAVTVSRPGANPPWRDELVL